MFMSSFEIHKTIGSGATSIVKLASDPEGNQVAIKILSFSAENEEDESNFNQKELVENEIEAMKILNGKHLGFVKMLLSGTGSYAFGAES